MSPTKALVLCIALAVVVPVSNLVDSATATIAVSATVRRNCTITTTPLAFGTYDPVVANATTPLDATATMTIACTMGTPATIGLDDGSNAVASQRRLTNGSSFLFSSSLRGFAAEGRGTLAPWDPPRHLVVHGPYRFVRNPMISGVLFVLAGEAMLLRSGPHAVWALVFLGINLVYIPLVEEPSLRLRFGEPYREYCEQVPRIFPRLRPWLPDPADKDAG